MITARQVVSVNWAMLKTSLIAGSLRSNSSTTIGPDQPGEHEVHRRREQQAEDERQVAERERVGAAAEVQVHHAALRGEEAEGQAPPRDVDADVELGQVVDGPGQQRRRRRARSRRSAPRRLLRPTGGASRPSEGTWVAHRRRERNPEALDGWTTAESAQQDRRAQQQVAGEADEAVEQRVELGVGHPAHDPRPLPGLRARPADAPQREEVVGGAEQRVDARDQVVGERALDVGLDGLEDPVDLLVVAELGAVVAGLGSSSCQVSTSACARSLLMWAFMPAIANWRARMPRSSLRRRTAAPTPSRPTRPRPRRRRPGSRTRRTGRRGARRTPGSRSVGSASRTASVTWRYMPLKQATPSGSGGRSRRAAGPPASGAKNPSSFCSIAVRRSTTSSTVRLAGTRLTRSASCGHGFGPGGHAGTLTRLRPRNPSRGPQPAAGFLASVVPGLREGDCRPDASIERRASPLIHRLARRRRPCPARRRAAPAAASSSSPRSRSPWAEQQLAEIAAGAGDERRGARAPRGARARPRSARAPRRGGPRSPRARRGSAGPSPSSR